MSDNSNDALPQVVPCSCGVGCQMAHVGQPCWGTVLACEEVQESDGNFGFVHACEGHFDCYERGEAGYRTFDPAEAKRASASFHSVPHSVMIERDRIPISLRPSAASAIGSIVHAPAPTAKKAAGSWSLTPPTEPGLYWVRARSPRFQTEYRMASVREDGSVRDLADNGRAGGNDYCGEDPWEFWSERQEPPE